MANVSLEIGNDTLALNNLKHLADASSDMKFIHQGFEALTSQLGALPDGSLGTLTLDAGNPSWTITDIPVKFSLKASIAYSVSLLSKGPLFNYCTDFEATHQVSVPLQPGKVYVVTEFQFQISGDLSANASLGEVGITTDDSGKVSYVIKNYKAFDPSTPCSDAIGDALAQFVLPLHADTVSILPTGDAIYYEFDGAINVGFGLTYGMSYSVAGQSLSELGGIFSKVKGVADVATKKSTIGASLGASAKFSWSRSFKAFLQRTGANSATLHIDAGKDTQRSLQLTANAGITQLSPPQLSLDASTVANDVQKKLLGNSAPPANSIFVAAAGQAESALQTEAGKYVDDANKWLQSLFQKVGNSASISIGLLIQDTQHFVSAFTWIFDLSKGDYAAAWEDAIKGDFAKALTTSAATLVPDSGFEQLHCKSTKLSFAMFGLLNCTSIESSFTQCDVHYAGKGLFYLEFKAGQVASSSSNKASTSTELYLDATATGAPNSDGSFNASNLQIQFHGILSSKGNASQVSRLRALLVSLLDLPQSSTAGDAALRSFLQLWLAAGAKSATGSTNIHLVFQFSALKRLQSDPYVRGNQAPPPHVSDMKNWNSYASASLNVASDPQAYLSSDMPGSDFYQSYDAWAKFNEVCNGYTDPQGNPVPGGKTNRHSLGGGALINQEAFIRQLFGSTVTNTTADQVIFYFAAGQQFMNLCDDVHTTLTSLDTSAVIDWDRLTKRLQQIAGNDIDAWYGSTVLLALGGACTISALSVDKQGLTDAGDASITISIT